MDRLDKGNPNPFELRIYWSNRLGNIHCRVFAGPLGNASNCGTLCFTESEFNHVRLMMPGVKWIDENAQHHNVTMRD